MNIVLKLGRRVKKLYSYCNIHRYRKRELSRVRNAAKANGLVLSSGSSEKDVQIRRFWSGFGFAIPLDWHHFFYQLTGVEDPAYIPEPVFQLEIKPFFNNPDESLIWSDKAYLDYFLRDCKTVRSIVRNTSGRFSDESFRLISLEEAQAIVDRYDRVVIKPSMNTHTGANVQLLEGTVSMKELDKKYQQDYVVQIPLQQHEEMKRLNASSVNTIRVNTVLSGTKAHVMTAFVKVGQAGEFADNHGSKRFFIGIRQDGTYCDFAIDHEFRKCSAIPSGFAFAGQKVPHFKEVCLAAERAHACIPHFGFAFWDICIDQAGDPVIVEANLRYPDLVIPQACGIGNFFGPYAEEVLQQYKKKKDLGIKP